MGLGGALQTHFVLLVWCPMYIDCCVGRTHNVSRGRISIRPLGIGPTATGRGGSPCLRFSLALCLLLAPGTPSAS